MNFYKITKTSSTPPPASYIFEEKTLHAHTGCDRQMADSLVKFAFLQPSQKVKKLYDCSAPSVPWGEMAEWSKATASKAVIP